MSEAENRWDLSVEIEGLSIRLRGLRVNHVPRASKRPASPSSLSASSFQLVRNPLPLFWPRRRPQNPQPVLLPLFSAEALRPSAHQSPQHLLCQRTLCRAPAITTLNIASSWLCLSRPSRTRVWVFAGLFQEASYPAYWVAGCWAGAVLRGRLTALILRRTLASLPGITVCSVL